MLAANVSIQRLLLCLLIVRNVVVCFESLDNPVQTVTPEVAKLPLVPESSKVPEPSLSSKEPRILERSTILKRENQHKRANTTLLLKKTANINEDDTSTTTHLPGPKSVESSSTKTMEFRPSVHIGEIHDYESRKSTTNPFNNVQHVKFENSVNIEEDHDTGRVQAPLSSSSSSLRDTERATLVAGRMKNRVKFFETDSRYGVAVPVEYYVPQVQQQMHQQQQTEEAVVSQDNGNNNDNYNELMPMSMGHEAVVTFEYPMAHYAEVTARPMALGRPVYPAMMTDQQMQHYEPGINNVRTVYLKPSKFHSEVVTPMPVHIQHYEYVAPVSGESMEKPDAPRHHQGSYQVVQQPTDTVAIAKPETLVLLSSQRETAFTRTRKFPYKFYHPDTMHQDNEYYYVPEGQQAYPPRMRVSPWKKIIHLIGAFLPLGLLLATLKPSIVQIDTQNTTQPNIVLSKLRDLPAEHKRGRMVNELDKVQQDTCEDKSICELIVGGSEPQANLLQNILWNITNKSTDEDAKKHGLDEIFAAVKQKDCSSIQC